MEELLMILPELSDEAKAELEQALSGQYEKGKNDQIKKQEKESFDAAIVKELENAGALNSEMALSVMDMENILFEDGEFLGFSEELARVKNEYGFLFRQEGPQFSSGQATGDDIDLASLNYLERLKLYRENPDLYKLKMNK